MRTRLSRFPSAMDGFYLVSARPQEERRNLEGAFDTDLYGAAGNRFDGYVTSIPASGDEADLSAASPTTLAPRLASYTGYGAVLLPSAVADDEDHTTNRESRRIIDREDEYRRRRLRRYLSPDRHDAFAAGEATPAPSVRTYADAMRENMLQHRKEELLREIAKIKEEQKQPVKRCDRWDVAAAVANNTSSAWDDDGAPDAATPKKQRSRWEDDATPPVMQRSRWADDETPPMMQRSRWDDDETPPKKQRSRWDDEAPAASMETPLGAEYLSTPTASQIAAWSRTTPEQYPYLPWERDLGEHARPLTDDELDAMFPQKGYKILQPPPSYQPIRTPARRLLAATPTPLCTPVFAVPEEYKVRLRFLGRCS